MITLSLNTRGGPETNEPSFVSMVCTLHTGLPVFASIAIRRPSCVPTNSRPFQNDSPRMPQPVRSLAAGDLGDFRVVAPQQLAGLGVDGVHEAVAGGHVDDAIHRERRRQVVGDVEIQRPGETQARHRLAIDLGQRAVMRLAEGAAVGGPVAAVGFVAECGIVDRGRPRTRSRPAAGNAHRIPSDAWRCLSRPRPRINVDFSTMAHSTQTEAGLAFRDNGRRAARRGNLPRVTREVTMRFVSDAELAHPHARRAARRRLAHPHPGGVATANSRRCRRARTSAASRRASATLADELAPQTRPEPPRIPLLGRRHVRRLPRDERSLRSGVHRQPRRSRHARRGRRARRRRSGSSSSSTARRISCATTTPSNC